MYFPETKITHIKKASKKTDQKQDLSSLLRGVEAMQIFYKKRLWQNYPFYVNFTVVAGINVLKLSRTIKYHLGL